MAGADEARTIEVVYARPDQQATVKLEYASGMSAADAVSRSGLPERFPEILGRPMVLGVWGIEVAENHKLKPGDRVEISRPLVADPRDMRRELLAGGRVMGGADRRPNRSRGSS